MSRLEELIQEFCPDGVEYRSFSDTCQYIRGVTYNKSQESKAGDINSHRVLRANNITLLSNTLNFDDVKLISSSVKIKKEQYFRQGDILICAGSGSKEHIGKVAYIASDIDYSFGGFMAVIRCQELLSSRFLFHILTGERFKRFLDMALNSSTINNLSFGVIKNFSIPVPPLPVQREIVRILDSFTDLTAELEARKKQYEYYRDQLLNFDALSAETTAPPRRTLREICNKWSSGATPKKGNSAYYDGGTVPWLRTQDVIFNEIYETTAFITETAVAETSANWVPENCVIVAISGASAGRCAIHKIPLTTNQHYLNMKIDSTVAMYKYVLYCVCNQYEDLLAKKEGARGDLNATRILSLDILVPSLSEQQRIVSILDRFDALCNDLTSGIPAEIEARRKQYEYYRDKLLSFPAKA